MAREPHIQRRLPTVISARDIPPSIVIPAMIDIQESFVFRPGEKRTVWFRYRAGVPQSTAFMVEWFRSENDSKSLLNPLSEIRYVLPSLRITPETPEPDTGYWQFGEVFVEVSDTYEDGRMLFGALIIDQPVEDDDNP